ncbi:hypothetical protein GOV03_02550 [Candidatus Woesearchaeota archaeon]|nr:hypothetical protein [Candidatus Woesearchaeota archaeon]
MPLKESKNGKECPLGKFQIDYSQQLDLDLMRKCLGCNFVNPSTEEELTLDNICQCPIDMTFKEYRQLMDQYGSLEDSPTKQGFQEYVKKHYQEK